MPIRPVEDYVLRTRKCPPPNTSSEVGYGKPPKEHQFKKGQSGNPKGRPKGSKNVTTLIEETLAAEIEYREKGRTKRATAKELIVRKMCEKALKGDLRAARELLNRLEAAEAKRSAASPAETASLEAIDAEDRAILARSLETQALEKGEAS